jgi:2-C-methyl-D-erythritol 4-phosphate cytidylyltransferase
MTKSVIIVAGGRGVRMSAEVPKQFLELCGKPILMHTVSVFYSFDKNIKIVLVLPETEIDFWKNLCEKYAFAIPHQIVQGGVERFFSVKNGLELIDTELVAIHDGVRPLVSHETLERTFEAAEKYGAAVPVAAVTESLRFVENECNKAVDRAKYRLVQTPQIFRQEIIKNAYSQDFTTEFTDDASVAESAGHKIFLTEGNRENIKITTPIDLKIAEILMK